MRPAAAPGAWAFVRKALEIVDAFAAGERSLASLEGELREWLVERGAKLPASAPSVVLVQHLLKVVHVAVEELDEACARLQGGVDPDWVEPLLRHGRRGRRVGR